MKWSFEPLATFLLKELGQAIQRWSVRFQNAENDESKAPVGQLPQVRCPFRPKFPGPDYLEAMLGDLLEWQNYLQKQGVSKRRILFLTMAAIIRLVGNIFVITWQNMSEAIKVAQQTDTADSATPSEVVSEGNPPDTNAV